MNLSHLILSALREGASTLNVIKKNAEASKPETKRVLQRVIESLLECIGGAPGETIVNAEGDAETTYTLMAGIKLNMKATKDGLHVYIPRLFEKTYPLDVDPKNVCADILDVLNQEGKKVELDHELKRVFSTLDVQAGYPYFTSGRWARNLYVLLTDTSGSFKIIVLRGDTCDDSALVATSDKPQMIEFLANVLKDLGPDVSGNRLVLPLCFDGTLDLDRAREVVSRLSSAIPQLVRLYRGIA